MIEKRNRRRPASLLGIALLAALLLSNMVGPANLARAASISTGPMLADTATPPPQGVDGIGPAFRSLNLEGTNSYVRVPNHPDLNPSSEITIEAWVWRNQADRCETVVGKNFTSSYWLGFCGTTIRFYAAGTGTSVDGAITIPPQRWTHVAVTYDGTTRRYYVDGDLDISSTANNGPLASNSSDLGIGRDLETSFTHNNFAGFIDEVRIWSVVRSQAEIQADMYSEVNSQAGLVEAWRFNGTADGSRGQHDGTLEGSAVYGFEGALPGSVRVSRSTATVTVDGSCDLGEYGSADRVGVEAATVYLQHGTDDVYICFEGLERGANRFAVVAVDRDYSRTDPAQPDDYRFTISGEGTTTAEQGDGSGGFVPLSPPPGSWQAAHALPSEFFWSAEFRFSRDFFGLTSWYDSAGLYLSELGRFTGDGIWPVGGEYNLPSTWALAAFSNYTSNPPTLSFSGHVQRQRDGAGLEGVTVQLWGSTSASTSLLDSTETDVSGAYSLSYYGYSPDVFIVQEIDPRGLHSVLADDGGDGSVSSPNVLVYPGSEDSHTYSPGTFVDAETRLTADALNQHYLIVYSEPVGVIDLWPLIEQKQMQGFQVETVSTQFIEATVSGYDLGEKIRNWLRGRWQVLDPDPVYALLVGRHDVIPVRQVGWEGDYAHRLPGDLGFAPALATDWYYADLDSNWDADGDHFYGEYLYCAPGQNEVPSVPWPGRSFMLPCPPAGSPLREGPFGTDPGTADDWLPEISIGRMENNDPAEVCLALKTAVASESSGSLDKRSALIGGAFWSFRGRSWDKDQNQYNDGSGPEIWRSWPGEGNQPYGNDTAEHLEVTLKPILDVFMDQVTRSYETTSPGGDSALIPTRFSPEFGLTRVNMEAQWSAQGFGLVNAEGHGTEDGVWTFHWTDDWNNNRQIDNPADPAESPGCTADDCWELTSWESFVHQNMPTPGGIAPVVFANACSTGAAWATAPILDAAGEPTGYVDWYAVANTAPGRLSAQGRIAAWVGGLSVVPVGGIDHIQDQFNADMLSLPLRLGDALWKHMPELIGGGSDWRLATLQLFGDPAYAYWGNAADTLAPWPQAGRDWRATSGTAYDGPVTGMVDWTTNDTAPRSAAVVDRYGNVLVGGVGHLAKFAPDGTKLDEVVLDTVPPGLEHEYAPALTTDGVYLASIRQLYVLDRNLDLREMVPIDGAVTGAVRVGPDGVAWVPTNEGMFRVTGAGLAQRVQGNGATGPVAFDPAGAVVWTTDTSVLHGYAMDRYGAVVTATVGFSGAGALTPPAVAPDGSVYVGTGSGHVVAVRAFPFQPDPELWQYGTGAAITAKPAVGVDGSVYVGNADGVVVALSEGGTLLWSRPLAAAGAPAVVAAPTADTNRLYVAAGSSLYALSLGTGDVLWTLPLGGSLDARSTPVIGGHGALYVTRSDQTLVAVYEYGWLLPVSDLELAPGVAQALVSWRDNSLGEVGFRVQTCTLEGVCATVGTAAADASSFLINSLPAGVPVYVRVQAVGVAGEGSGLLAVGSEDANYSSDYAYADLLYTLPALPATPTGPAAAAESTTAISVSWSYGGGDAALLTGFAIYRSAGAGGPYAQVGTVSAGSRSFIDAGLEAAATYYYEVAALNESGASGHAGPVSATTKSRDLPSPTDLTLAQRYGAFVLHWQDQATTEQGYMVERRVPGLGDYEVVGAVAANTTVYTDGVDFADGQYTYRIKAFARDSESGYAYATAVYSAQPYAIYLPVVWK
jgi:hypothetical protein